MARFVIRGGVPLKGQIKLLGAKNVGFKLLIAALAADSPSVIDNVARIKDVETVKEIVEDLGGKVEFIANHKIKVDPRGLKSSSVPGCYGEKTRAPTLCVGPLVARFGKAFVSLPGGDQIGQRPVDRHIEGLTSLGLVVKGRNGGLEFTGNLQGGRYRFEKNSHTGTESLILAAVRAKGKTIIENAASEPEVTDLIGFLNKMGAKIKRVEPKIIEIEGVNKLVGTDYSVMPDRNEAVTFAAAALVTNGDIKIEEARKEHLLAFEKALGESGATFEFSEKALHVWRASGTNLKATNITTAPHPGFMTDWQPLWATVMTQAVGTSIIHETVFESRFAYVSYLRKMGAKIEFFNPTVVDPEKSYNFSRGETAAKDPHAIKIFGPCQLRGKRLTVSDIRAGATLVLAALAARGESVLEDIEHIERGYENLEGRLETLGAKIKKVD